MGWSGSSRDARHQRSSVQKRRGSQIELFEESKKEQRQRRFTVANNGGTVRWNVIATCGTCTPRWTMARQRLRKRYGAKIHGTLVPFGAKVSSSKGLARLDQLKKKQKVSRNRQGNVLRSARGRSGDLLIADLKDLENLLTSHSSIFCNPHAGDLPAKGIPEQYEKEEEDTFFRRRRRKRQILLEHEW